MILDGIVLLVLLVFCVSGARSGLIKSFLSFVGLMVSIIASTYLSSGFSETIYNNVIKENVMLQIERSINGNGTTSDAILEVLPDFISNSFSYYGITKEKLSNIINSGKVDIVNEIEKVISPIFIQTIKISLAMILFFAFLLVYGVIAKWAVSVFRIPIIRQINFSLGALFGILKGYIFITLLAFCLNVGVQIMNLSFGVLTYNNIESTYIFKYVYTNNLISNLIHEI